MKLSERLMAAYNYALQHHASFIDLSDIQEIQVLEHDSELLNKVIKLIEEDGHDVYDNFVTAKPMTIREVLEQL